MVFKVASYMATGVRFALAGPALACLYKGLGQAAVGLPSLAQWPYLYTWLAVYFHTHEEDLTGARRPGMISFGNPSLQRAFDEDQARDLFRRLPVLVWNRYPLGESTVSSLVDEPKRTIPRATYESLLSIHCCYLTAHRRLRYFIEPYNPARFARQFGYCQDLPGDLEAEVSQRDTTSLFKLMTFWRASVASPCGRLDLPLISEPARGPGTTLAYYTWWKEHKSPRFEQNRLELVPVVSAAGNSEEEEDYDSDRSHPRRRRRSKGKKPVSVSSANRKRAPLAALNDTTVKKKPREEAPLVSFPPSPPTFLPPIPEVEPSVESQPPLELDPPETETIHISSSPEAPEAEAPREEASLLASTVQIGSCAFEGTTVVEELVEVALSSTQPEALPAPEVVPPIVQEAAEEATIEEAAPSDSAVIEVEASIVQEEVILVLKEVVDIVQGEVPTATEKVAEVVPATEEVVEVVQEEVPTSTEEVAEAVPAVEEAL